jgi:hypothetical protein
LLRRSNSSLASRAARRGQDVLVPHIGRIADDGVELFGQRIGEEIHHLRAGGATRSVELDRGAAGQTGRERAIAGRRLEHAAAVASQREHPRHHIVAGEHLPQMGHGVRLLKKRGGHERTHVRHSSRH